MRLYLDAVVTIYYVQRVAGFFPRVLPWVNVPGTDIVVSDLTRMECLVKPKRVRDAKLISLFESFFRTAEVVDLPTPAFERATDIRAQFHFKTPDALHLAAAIEAGCDAFLTNDHRLSGFSGIRVEII